MIMVGKLQICPNCKIELQILPVESDQEMPCPSCRHTINIKSTRGKLSQRKEFEVLLFLTLLCSLANLSTNHIFLAIATGFSIISLGLLYFHDHTGKVIPSAISWYFELFLLRLRVFPYELLVPFTWLAVYILNFMNFRHQVALSVSIFIFSLIF